MGGIGGAVFDLAEKAAPKLGPLGDLALKTMEHTFGLESVLTGKSGAAITDHLKMFQSEKAIGRSVANQQALATAKSGGVLAKPADIATQVTKAARTKVFGGKDEVLAGLVKAVEHEHGYTKAQLVTDHLGTYFHEQEYPGGSTLQQNLNRNPINKDSGTRYTSSNYTAPTSGEQFLKHGFTAGLAFKAGLAHTTTNLNMLMDQSLASYGKSLKYMFGDNYKGAKAQLAVTGGLGHLFETEYNQLYAIRTGAITKYIPGSFGEFISKNFLIPGMDAVRNRNMVMAAMQGKFVAEESAAKLLHGTPEQARIAAIDLQHLRIDPAEVRSRGLLPEHIQHAQSQNAQNTLHLDQGLSKSDWGQNTAIGRLTTMYHSYGVMQAKFMANTIKKEMLEKHDPMSIIKLITTMGVIAPAAGNAIYSLEQQWAGKEHGQFLEKLGQREKVLLDARQLGERIDAITHIAGFGILSTYSRAASRSHLATQMMGPVLNSGIELGQDTLKAATGTAKWTPVARDLLHDIPSVGATGWLAHKYFPTAAEEREAKPMTAARLRAKRGAAKRKLRTEAKKESN